jgi:hypothetical protein
MEKDKILGTKDELNLQVRKLIEEADEFLILVTPYFDPPESIMRVIIKALQKKRVELTLIVRKDKVNETFMERLDVTTISRGLGTVKCIDWLHAKIYVSEKSAILASMNLVGSSMIYSKEIGAQFFPPNRMYQDLKAQAVKFSEDSEYVFPHPVPQSSSSSASAFSSFQLSAPSDYVLPHPVPQSSSSSSSAFPSFQRSAPSDYVFPHPVPQSSSSSASAFSSFQRSAPSLPHQIDQSKRTRETDSAYCIVCEKKAKLSVPDIQPFCKMCFRKKKDQMELMFEGFCHICRKKHNVSGCIPLCKGCYDKTKGMFTFFKKSRN